jgi:hypothetical protein
VGLEERVSEKRDDILGALRRELQAHSVRKGWGLADQRLKDMSEAVMDRFVRITPPVADKRPEFITMKPGGIGGGVSVRPGNVFLNWKKLLADSSESILTVIGAIEIPWLIPLAGLVVWGKVRSLVDVDLDERHAAVMWTLWKNKEEGNFIDSSKMLGLVNVELGRYDRPVMNDEELGEILSDLEKLGCIKRIDDGRVLLEEEVKATYE